MSALLLGDFYFCSVQNKLFPQAISYLEKTFQVRKSTGTILLSRYVKVCILRCIAFKKRIK